VIVAIKRNGPESNTHQQHVESICLKQCIERIFDLLTTFNFWDKSGDHGTSISVYCRLLPIEYKGNKLPVAFDMLLLWTVLNALTITLPRQSCPWVQFLQPNPTHNPTKLHTTNNKPSAQGRQL